MKKILFVEDNGFTSGPLERGLKDFHDLEVIRIEYGDEAINEIIASDPPFDAIIVDIMMPVPDDWSEREKNDSKDGLETGNVLIKKIRAIKPTLPILIYSAKTLTLELDKHTYYFRKPETIQKVFKKLTELSHNEK